MNTAVEQTLHVMRLLWPGVPPTVPDKYKPLEIPGRVRNEIPHLLSSIGAKVGVEVGVERGEYSKVLMHGVAERLHLVDAWAHYPGYRDHVSSEKLEGFYTHVLGLADKYPVLRPMRGWSVDMAKEFGDGSLDFVYIDANHTLPQVIADLAAWSPKVRTGGLIMGHDYRKPKNNIGHHVVEAVNAWTYSYRINPWFLLGANGDSNRDQNRSYLWVKE